MSTSTARRVAAPPRGVLGYAVVERSNATGAWNLDHVGLYLTRAEAQRDAAEARACAASPDDFTYAVAEVRLTEAVNTDG